MAGRAAFVAGSAGRMRCRRRGIRRAGGRLPGISPAGWRDVSAAMESAGFAGGATWVSADSGDETMTGFVMYIRQKSAAVAVLAESSQGYARWAVHAGGAAVGRWRSRRGLGQGDQAATGLVCRRILFSAACGAGRGFMGWAEAGWAPAFCRARVRRRPRSSRWSGPKRRETW